MEFRPRLRGKKLKNHKYFKEISELLDIIKILINKKEEEAPKADAAPAAEAPKEEAPKADAAPAAEAPAEEKK